MTGPFASAGPLGRRSVLILAAAAMCAGFPRRAFALDLAQAKAQGWIGERRDGYLGAIDGAPAEARAVVEQINSERQAAYSDVAASNRVPVNQVEALAGQKLIERAAPGDYIMDAAGRWIRK
jgi:uncharacterized protein